MRLQRRAQQFRVPAYLLELLQNHHSIVRFRPHEYNLLNWNQLQTLFPGFPLVQMEQ